MSKKPKFKFFKQHDTYDCGPTCLRMISHFYGKSYSPQFLRDVAHVTREGVSLYTISKAAETLGFSTLRMKLTVDYLIENVPVPCILHWNNDHFVVLSKIKGSLLKKEKLRFYIADPGAGELVLDYRTFGSCWGLTSDPSKGFALALEPDDAFYESHHQETKPSRFIEIKYLLHYFNKHKGSFTQLFVGLLIGALLSFTFPFLTQMMVDNGIISKDLSFVTLILFFQLFVFLGTTVIDLVRNFLVLHIGTNVNISIISDFLSKLMRLPLKFFDSKLTGDILQRIEDHKRIESFLTTTILDTVFSILNLAIMMIVLTVFGVKFLVIFLLMSIITFSYSMLFMNRIKLADYKMFNYFSKNRENLYEIINGMPEIKLNSFELYQRWKWKENQLKLFSITSYVMKLRQYQKLGSVFFTQLKNIIITYVSVVAVIHGQITFGAMLSISYIIGQLNSPIDQLINFFGSAQSAKISLERMMEIHMQENEEPDLAASTQPATITRQHMALDKMLASSGDIEFKNVSFQYEDEKSNMVLDELNIKIPLGKITAIVGESGSGKTTLLKILLKFYKPTAGMITINNRDLEKISSADWRAQCGVVMQEGFLFSDTILKNITMGDDDVDMKKVMKVCSTANILDFIQSLPLQFETKLGGAGINISTGQKQRILIARAIYKNPAILLFDEATSALDASNERQIVLNLNSVFVNKTVIIIAHRLSTVKNADHIIVLEKGNILETGTHNQLVVEKGRYFHLIKDQLELGV